MGGLEINKILSLKLRNSYSSYVIKTIKIGRNLTASYM